MLNFWHIVLVLGILDIAIVALMLGSEVLAVEVVSGSWQEHSFSRLSTSCLSSFFNLWLGGCSWNFTWWRGLDG
jgi:hypothetical protein